MRASLISLLVVFGLASAYAQQSGHLSVDRIMRDPKWIGISPSSPYWSPDGKVLYFNWNPENAVADSLYKITLANRTPRKVSKAERMSLPSRNGKYNRANTRMVYEKNGDIFLLDIPSSRTIQVTNTVANEGAPSFSGDEKSIVFTLDRNLFSWEIATGIFTQITDFKTGKKKETNKLSEQERWLKQDQLAYFDVLRERNDRHALQKQIQKNERPVRPKEIFTDDRFAIDPRLSPDGGYVTFRLAKSGSGKGTIVPSYVTVSGFTEDLPTRAKVGGGQPTSDLYVYDIAKDTVLQVKTEQIPGIYDVPQYLTGYDKATHAQDEKKPKARSVTFNGPSWSDDGRFAVVYIAAQDNKDRWLMLLDVATQSLSLIARLHDDAWIGGISDYKYGWVNNEVWFLSEATGYSHLSVFNPVSGSMRQITSGNYEVQDVKVSRSKKFFYLVTNAVHPGEKHFYRVSIQGGAPEQLTTKEGGHDDVVVSPDEKMMAYLHSTATRPWELYLSETRAGSKAQQITQSTTPEFRAYSWREPEIVRVRARDGTDVYSRLYRPANPNGAAVIFVHGAGYLQNAHKWWSRYFREYMFHNLLVEKGYTVLDMDYRASAGYGRDWRTGIYQHMGGKDLTDHVDGAAWLVSNHGIDAGRIGIYGGSYGGFITLMALFTEPDVFAAGAALRPVTDWAHYNHQYTSNILNVPYADSVAYAKSSPIYHAEGLKGALLICHGMIDVNVHFQDVVRLSQRLIELGKDNWELAVYPLEDHGFVEPSSWADEYKRILKLFEENLNRKAGF
jgi:dipeptidyl aminopeptidase/acylaminoacyl peptidase